MKDTRAKCHEKPIGCTCCIKMRMRHLHGIGCILLGQRNESCDKPAPPAHGGR